VIPVYNGAATISRVVDEIMADIGDRVHEIILVNDGSPNDNSEDVCRELSLRNHLVHYVSLRRNFGEHNAVMCGLNFASGGIVGILDDDLQNPPSEIARMADVIEKGFDVVYGSYREKKHSWGRNLGSKFNDVLATLLLDKPSDLYLSSFKVIRLQVVQEVIKYTGPFPYIDGLIFRVTRNVTSLPVEHRSREIGRSNYTFRRLVRLWLNMFLNFSVLPLRMVTMMGTFSFFVGLLLAVLTLIEWLISSGIPLGYPSLFIAIMMLSGAQLISLGLIGEYVGKSYMVQNGTPQWIIKESSFKTNGQHDAHHEV
jgi:undecaprenyl-phosphate 4-deoxy-4-formamido-L-arabinose transferase